MREGKGRTGEDGPEGAERCAPSEGEHEGDEAREDGGCQERHNESESARALP